MVFFIYSCLSRCFLAYFCMSIVGFDNRKNIRMKQSLLCIYVLIFFLSIFSGCQHRSEKASEEMCVIEKVVRDNPELAIRLIEEFDPISRDYDELTRMRFELLKIRVRDKNFEVHKDDRQIKSLVHYFERKGNPNDIMAAHYYMGRISRDLGRSQDAMMWFKSAYHAADTAAPDFNKDIFTGIVAQIANTYLHSYNFKEQFKWLKILESYADTTDYSTYKSVATCYVSLGKNDSAGIYYKKALAAAQHALRMTRAKKGAVREAVSFFVEHKDTGVVLQYKDLFLLCKDPEEKTGVADYIYGEYYDFMGNKDSSIYYLRCASMGSRKATAAGAHRYLSGLYRGLGLKDSALHHAEQSFIANDSAVFEEDAHRFLALNRIYDMEAAEEMAQKAKEEAAKHRMFLWLTIGVALGLIGMFVLHDLRKNHRAKCQLKQTVENYEEKLKKAQMAYEILQEVQRNNVNGDGTENVTEGTLSTQKDKNYEAERISLFLLERGNAGQSLSKGLWLELISVLNWFYVDFQGKMKELTKSSPYTDLQCLALTMLDIGGQTTATLLDMSRQNVLRIRSKYRQRLKELGVEETTELKDMLKAYLERQA